jgi:hypothetical protein
MPAEIDIITRVRRSAARRILYLPHAVGQMSRPERMITVFDVRKAVEKGELIEDCPEDIRGPSCLILGYGTDGTPVHVVRSPKANYLAIFTAYLPSPKEWENNLKKRKRP